MDGPATQVIPQESIDFPRLRVQEGRPQTWRLESLCSWLQEKLVHRNNLQLPVLSFLWAEVANIALRPSSKILLKNQKMQIQNFVSLEIIRSYLAGCCRRVGLPPTRTLLQFPRVTQLTLLWDVMAKGIAK